MCGFGCIYSKLISVLCHLMYIHTHTHTHTHTHAYMCCMCVYIFIFAGIPTLGKNVVVAGRSKNVGMPIAMLLHTDGAHERPGGKEVTFPAV